MQIITAQRYHNPLLDIKPVTNAQNVLEVQNYLSSVEIKRQRTALCDPSV